ncbi:MAG: methyltransferase domain-containing protein, partial [Bacteroidota bacterium]|nr:methyltransferase domain-containing protein [Bacteroidota bacterium]
MSTELTKEKRIWFEKIKKNNVLHHQINLLEEICTNKNVLDVGCVGQAVNYENPDWVHNKIRNVSNKIVGVDINHEGIEKLKKRGYDIFHYNQLNKDERFDVIIILDVIEHVNDPVEFMNIYQRF